MLFLENLSTKSLFNQDYFYGAGEGNRTLVISLEGFCSTIELHPRWFQGRGSAAEYNIPPNVIAGLDPAIHAAVANMHT
jgi:hypothetical protein